MTKRLQRERSIFSNELCSKKKITKLNTFYIFGLNSFIKAGKYLKKRKNVIQVDGSIGTSIIANNLIYNTKRLLEIRNYLKLLLQNIKVLVHK